MTKTRASSAARVVISRDEASNVSSLGIRGTPIRLVDGKFSLEIGARVEILQHKVLKCSRFGFVLNIDGAYNSVQPEFVSDGSAAPEDCVFELYPNELRVVTVYRHVEFVAGARVRIVAPLNWGRRKPREFAKVLGVSATKIMIQPIGPRNGTIMAAPFEALAVTA
jgi:hypothetical protein